MVLDIITLYQYFKSGFPHFKKKLRAGKFIYYIRDLLFKYTMKLNWQDNISLLEVTLYIIYDSKLLFNHFLHSKAFKL